MRLLTFSPLLHFTLLLLLLSFEDAYVPLLNRGVDEGAKAEVAVLEMKRVSVGESLTRLLTTSLTAPLNAPLAASLNAPLAAPLAALDVTIAEEGFLVTWDGTAAAADAAA